jgi:hypothetical protein
MRRGALLLLSLPVLLCVGAVGAPGPYVSISGDPFYTSADPAVLLASWNFCNGARAAPQFPTHPSPRWADCALGGAQQVGAAANALGPGDALPGFNATTDANAYAVDKELYLGALCSRAPAAPSAATQGNYSFHTVMWKSGNMDVAAQICPSTRRQLLPPRLRARFNNLPMNQPLVQLPATAAAGS